MGTSMECLTEIDDFRDGVAEESTMNTATWGVFKAYAFFYFINYDRSLKGAWIGPTSY